jgi:UDP-N-acetylglucosamine 3-dehydrogenase
MNAPNGVQPQPGSDGPRVVLFGAGTMGRIHAAAWRRLGVPIECVVDPRAEAGRTLADEVAGHYCRTGEEAVSRHPQFTVADIAVPTFAHHETLQTLPSGPARLVVLEKPLERDPVRAAGVLEAAQARHAALFVAHVVRFFPAYRAIHDRILAEGVDTVHHVRLRRVGPPPRGIGDWYLDEALSGGIFLDLLIHDLDFCLWTFGPPTRVMARASHHPDDSRFDHPVARHVSAVLSYEGARVVHLEGSWMYPGPFSTRVEVDADWGTLVHDRERERPVSEYRFASEKGEPSRLTQASGTAVPSPSVPDRQDPYAMELDAALAAHAAGQPLPITPSEALDAVVLADLCRRAARAGESLAWPGEPTTAHGPAGSDGRDQP